MTGIPLVGNEAEMVAAIGLRMRLLVPLALVLVAYGVFHVAMTMRSQRKEILAEAELSTIRLARTVRRTTRTAMLDSRREDVHRMIAEIGKQEGLDHVRIVNKEGVVMYSADRSELHRVVDRDAEGCVQCHDAREPLTRLETAERTRLVSSGEGHRTLAAIEVVYNEPSCANAACHAHSASRNLLGVIDVGVSLDEADARVALSARHTLLWGIASTLAICLVAGWLIQRLVNRPVQQLLECTKKVANGDLQCTLRRSGDDEISVLARSFCGMTEELGRARGAQERWAETLEEEVASKTHDLRLAQEQVLRSEKLSSVGLLAAGVAHELNSPLTGILTYAHLVARNCAEGSETRADMEVIVQQADRCASIIRQLLDFSRERAPEKHAQDIRPIIDQVIALVEHQASFHGIQIHRDYADRVPDVLIDASQMQQVLINLLVNSAEAMPEGGTLTVSNRIHGELDGCEEPSIEIRVSDSGIGIPAESIPKIFDPFFTSKEVGKGTGLGLAVSYGIVERHGGRIDVQSVEGEGTTFTIILPAVIERVAVDSGEVT